MVEGVQHHQLGGDDAPRWLFIAAVIGLLLLCLLLYKTQAQLPQSQRYMLLYAGADGLNLDCVDEYPYTDVWRMTDIECERNRCAVHVNRGAW